MPCVIRLALYHLFKHVLLRCVLLRVNYIRIADVLNVIVLHWLRRLRHRFLVGGALDAVAIILE